MQKVIFISSLVVFLLVGMAGCDVNKSLLAGNRFEVERVIDGDTIVLVGDRTVRYIGIDTPERGDPYYKEATDANRHLVEGKKVRLELDEDEEDRYDRTLAYVYVGDVFVNAELVKDGYARAYPYPPNKKYKSVFASAEREARQNNVGMWSSELQGQVLEIVEINSDAEGNDRKNINGEWVVIFNNTDADVNMTGFTLSDDSSHVYSFENFTMLAGGTVTVFSGLGADDPTSLYWNSKTPIWNNNGDTAYLKDADGVPVDEYSY